MTPRDPGARPETRRRRRRKVHEIGNHSWNHRPVIDRLQAEGYRFVTVSELIG